MLETPTIDCDEFRISVSLGILLSVRLHLRIPSIPQCLARVLGRANVLHFGCASLEGKVARKRESQRSHHLPFYPMSYFRSSSARASPAHTRAPSIQGTLSASDGQHIAIHSDVRADTLFLDIGSSTSPGRDSDRIPVSCRSESSKG